MQDFKGIDNLVRLLSAESKRVRDAVLDELRTNHEQLSSYIETNQMRLEPEVLFQLHELCREQESAAKRARWLAWTSRKSEFVKLEEGLAFLAETFNDQMPFPPLSQLLDTLVSDFLKVSDATSVDALNHFLFVSGRFKGARDDYYLPLHSNLSYVLEKGRGLPISLAIIMILMGYRLGLNIQGFNLPGHFLIRVRENGKVSLIDCFNGGKRLDEGEMAALSLSPKVQFQRLLDEPPTAVEIINRVLVNMVNAYHRIGAVDLQVLAQELLSDLSHHVEGKTALVATAGKAAFQPGQVVRHRNYGYRGVVVELDLTCQADEQWYQSNRTKPEKNQPWYHVLVDGSTVATYAAQANLEADHNPSEVRHPLIPLYFQGFQNGFYSRNKVPWSLS